MVWGASTRDGRVALSCLALIKHFPCGRQGRAGRAGPMFSLAVTQGKVLPIGHWAPLRGGTGSDARGRWGPTARVAAGQRHSSLRFVQGGGACRDSLAEPVCLGLGRVPRSNKEEGGPSSGQASQGPHNSAQRLPCTPGPETGVRSRLCLQPAVRSWPSLQPPLSLRALVRGCGRLAQRLGAARSVDSI